MVAVTKDAGRVGDGPTPSNFALGLGLTALAANLSVFYTSILGALCGFTCGALAWVSARAELTSIATGDTGAPLDVWRKRKAKTSLALGMISTILPAAVLILLLAFLFWLAGTGRLD